MVKVFSIFRPHVLPSTSSRFGRRSSSSSSSIEPEQQNARGRQPIAAAEHVARDRFFGLLVGDGVVPTAADDSADHRQADRAPTSQCREPERRQREPAQFHVARVGCGRGGRVEPHAEQAGQHGRLRTDRFQ